jgi:hypothetical protein
LLRHDNETAGSVRWLAQASTKEEKIALTMAGWEFVMYDPKEQTYMFRKKSNLV